ncbi:hypothetical protein LFYK43_14240 [Ligilactobacillus salitolerans]|uniref:Uncharacterized protein n=1 Tax=Ligilactobacillus salitolerans TaxID=1808352 RepID=A0A401ITX3_9LACO|nr:hypothetical protein [Ligilactobacillus salitolerans]GBG94965.1 hypothetical protein LFYK43_14240 [Ligilactobacillus salitolerans]
MYVLGSIFLSKQWISILSLIISITSGLASIIAIMSFFRNKAELIIFTDKKKNSWTPIAEGEITFTNESGTSFTLPSGVLFHYQFLNPSPHDIAFFNLHFDAAGKACQFFYDKSVGYATKNPTFIHYDLIKTAELPFPHEPQGTFKANSLTPLYCFLSNEELASADHGTIKLCYAIRKFPYLGKRNHFTTFKHYVNLENLPELVRSKQEIMTKLTQSEQKSQKTSNTHPHKNKRKKHK